MPDSKITALTETTTGAMSSSDVFVLVDVSDTTMAASGTDKKLRTDELSSTVATLLPSSSVAIAAVANFGEAVQDVMGVTLQSTSTIGFTYTDASNKEEAYLAIDVYSIVQAVDTVTTTNYTLVLGDAGHFKLLNTTTVGLFRLPLNASVALPVGTHVDFAQVNVGQFTVTTQAGVTLTVNPSTARTTTSAAGSVIKTATDSWIATGYLV